MKNLSVSPAWDETPRTNALVEEIQSTSIPFQIAYWRLLELTRTLEVENNKLNKPKKPKVLDSRQPKMEALAPKRQGRPRSRVARKL